MTNDASPFDNLTLDLPDDIGDDFSFEDFAFSTENRTYSPREVPGPKPQARARRSMKISAILLGSIAAILLVVGLYFGIRGVKDSFGGKLTQGVFVEDLDLGGMNLSQARSAIRKSFETPLRKTSMEILLPGKSLSLHPNQAGVALDTKALLKSAQAAGVLETPSLEPFHLADYLTIDTAAITKVLDDYAQQFGDRYIPSGYTIRNLPADLHTISDSTEPPTLVLTLGQEGYALDNEEILASVLDAYRQCQFRVEVSQPSATRKPNPIDLAAIAETACIPAVEPSIDHETLQLIPGQYGYGFDLDEAAKAVSEKHSGELAIPMHYIAPEIHDEDAWFQDVVGSCDTPHGNNANRTDNLKLACASINGLILQPGETFSYNETLGERTIERGYKNAPAYSGTNLIDSPGGGICQVSSTLYLASVYAEMTILERVNHGFPVSYIPLGMDATVNWGFTDLKFRNDTQLPIKIQAEVTDGAVHVQILGTEIRDYTVEMSYTCGGRFAKSYKSKIDKATGQLISKEAFALSAYLEDIC